MSSTKYIELIYNTIEKNRVNGYNYYVPSAWIVNQNHAYDIIRVNPFDFFLKQIEFIFLSNPQKKHKIREAKPIVYNIFPRYSTCFDHNNDGTINLEPIDDLFYETGTLLKSLALLPYLHYLGVDIIYLLPIFDIGLDGRKGNLGSPYAIRNFFKFDPRLSEPFLDIPLEEQFKAFVEAAHRLKIKVILEFVFRVVSLDCDYAIEHPEWFYWIYDEKCEKLLFPPKFTEEQLNDIEKNVKCNNFDNLITPSKEYQNLFSIPPQKVFKINNKIYGLDKKGSLLRIPNAFADWPPNDKQPIWSDVTYLKYFVHPDFNYIAYNTVRMYDNRVRREDSYNKGLWEFLVDVIPNYVQNFDIDGAMLDMGHAMPSELLDEIISKAKRCKDGFILWEENFNITYESKQKGYDGVLGYLPFDQENPSKIREIIKKMEKKEIPLPFFLTGETHNTPRSARFGCEFNRFIWAFNSFLNGLRFILCGFELCEVFPINTGLAFSEAEIRRFSEEKLPLFSARGMDWISFSIVNTICKVNKLHNKIFEDVQLNSTKWEDLPPIRLIETFDSEIVAYEVILKNFESLVVLGNFSNVEKIFSFENFHKRIVEIYPSYNDNKDLLKKVSLKGFTCKIFLVIEIKQS